MWRRLPETLKAVDCRMKKRGTQVEVGAPFFSGGQDERRGAETWRHAAQIARQLVFLAEVFFVFDLLEVLPDVARDDLPELDLEDFVVAFFELLPLGVCLPLLLLCLPEDAPEPEGSELRARAGGTGSFQLNANIWAPT